MKTNKLLSDLNQFIGTLNYFKVDHISDFKMTDGIKYLCDAVGFYWCISDLAISLHFKKVNDPFLIAKIEVNKNHEAVVSVRQDQNEKPIYTQKYEYTDFPLKEFEFYICDKVFLLKNEY